MKRVLFLLCLLLGFSFSGSTFAQWGPARIIKSAPDTAIVTAFYYYQRTIAADSFGRVHVVWTQFPVDTTGGQPSWLYYMRSTDWGATWEQPILLSQPGQDAIVPSITADGLGNVHVVWMGLVPGGYGAIYRRSPDGGRSWEPETTLVFDPNGFPTNPQVEANRRSGIVHVIWSNGDVCYKRSVDSGKTWSADTLLSASPYGDQNISLSLDSKGRPHITWYEDLGMVTPGRIWYKNSSDEGLSWNPSVMIADSDTTLPGAPNIAIDGLDRVYVFFTAFWGSKPDSTWSGQIVYRVSRDTGQTFGPRRPLTVYPSESGLVSVAGDLKGGVHVVYADTIPYGSSGLWLFYNGSTDGGATWRYHPPFNLTDSFQGGLPSLTAAPDGRVHLEYLTGTRNPTFTSWIIYRSGFPLGVEAYPKGNWGGRDLARLEVYPNPVTSLAYLRVQVPSGVKASLKIFDITGRLVRVLSSNLKAPKEAVVWDGKDGWGRSVPSGVYLCRLEGGGVETRQKTMVLIR